MEHDFPTRSPALRLRNREHIIQAFDCSLHAVWNRLHADAYDKVRRAVPQHPLHVFYRTAFLHPGCERASQNLVGYQRDFQGVRDGA